MGCALLVRWWGLGRAPPTVVQTVHSTHGTHLVAANVLFLQNKIWNWSKCVFFCILCDVFKILFWRFFDTQNTPKLQPFCSCTFHD